MLVRIVSAPRGLDLEGVTQSIVCCLGKTTTCPDVEQPVLDILFGDDSDIAKLASKTRIIVERN
ncbi:hypothetical protein HY311_00615 [Candidatus Nomurabacteria bacterium]|nr:hypothetical protein [Candidatus Nomurabacteria bacterium]